MLTVWACLIPQQDDRELYSFVGVYATEEEAFDAGKKHTDLLPYVEPFHFRLTPTES